MILLTSFISKLDFTRAADAVFATIMVGFAASILGVLIKLVMVFQRDSRKREEESQEIIERREVAEAEERKRREVAEAEERKRREIAEAEERKRTEAERKAMYKTLLRMGRQYYSQREKDRAFDQVEREKQRKHDAEESAKDRVLDEKKRHDFRDTVHPVLLTLVETNKNMIDAFKSLEKKIDGRV